MTTNQTDSELADGTPGSSNQVGSAGSGQPDSYDVEALVSKLLEHPEFKKAIDRSTQSVKDRRFSQLESEHGSFKEQLARLKEIQSEGFSEAQALRLMDVEKPPLNREPATPERKVDTRPQAANAEAMALILGTLELDPNDPKVIDTMRVSGDELTRMQALLTIAADKKARKNQPANPAAVQTTTGGNVPVSSKTELTARLQKLLNNPLADNKEIADVKAKLKEAIKNN
jgi:hypothetical protein